MNEPTPEEKARCMAEVKAELLREADWESDEQYTILLIQDLQEKGGYSGDEIAAGLEGKPVFVPPWY